MLRKPLPRRSQPARAAVGLAALSIALAFVPPCAAVAEQATSAVPSPLAEPARRRVPPQPPAWLGDHVHFEKGYGFGYRRAFRVGETPLELGLKGPVVRKKKRLGLTLEVRF